MNDCSQRLGFHAAAIFAQAGAAGTGRPFDIHLTSKCLLSRSLLSSLLVSPPSVTRPFILRHDFWPQRFCCSTYLPFSFFPPPTHIREMRCLLFITKKKRKKKRGRHKVKRLCLWKLSSPTLISVNAAVMTPPPHFPPVFSVITERSQTGFCRQNKDLPEC